MSQRLVTAKSDGLAFLSTYSLQCARKRTDGVPNHEVESAIPVEIMKDRRRVWPLATKELIENADTNGIRKRIVRALRNEPRAANCGRAYDQHAL